MTLETCDESDEETWPDQQKFPGNQFQALLVKELYRMPWVWEINNWYTDNNKDKDNDNDKDKDNDKDNDKDI